MRSFAAAAAALALAACKSAPAPSGEPPAEAYDRGPNARRGLAQIFDQHCGGALITPGAQARMRHPAAKTAFIVLAGARNTAASPAARFVTRADGSFEVPRLPPGTYCVVRRQLGADEEARLLALPPPVPRPPAPPNREYVDEDCVKRLPLACDATWDAGSEQFEPFIALPGNTCPWSRPCVEYDGPPPP